MARRTTWQAVSLPIPAPFTLTLGGSCTSPATGRIRVTDTRAAFQSAAAPIVPAAYNNDCVQGLLSHVGGGISRTSHVPVTPVSLGGSTAAIGRRGVGVALNGITIDAPAPVAAITIAAFDDCGAVVRQQAARNQE